jgi:hypothetical protein
MVDGDPMIELIQRLLIGHAHQYTTIKEVEYKASTIYPTRFVYVMQCTHCGKIKSKTVTP